jgi:hypothetical protein
LAEEGVQLVALATAAEFRNECVQGKQGSKGTVLFCFVDFVFQNHLYS